MHFEESRQSQFFKRDIKNFAQQSSMTSLLPPKAGLRHRVGQTQLFHTVSLYKNKLFIFLCQDKSKLDKSKLTKVSLNCHRCNFALCALAQVAAMGSANSLHLTGTKTSSL